MPAQEETWSSELETNDACAARGVAALRWIAARPEQEIAVVAHGGIYHSMSRLLTDPKGLLTPRFGNCELRTVRLECSSDGEIRVGAA